MREMAWRTMEVQDQRVRFVVAASGGERSVSELCREFGISRPTGYKWLSRYRGAGVAGIREHSRRLLRTPRNEPLNRDRATDSGSYVVNGPTGGRASY